MTRGYSNVPTLILASHICAAILLVNFWHLKWRERNQMRRDGLENTKSFLSLAITGLLEEISVFIEALKTVKPRWRSAELYLSVLTAFLSPRSSLNVNRNDLSPSLPRSLGGYEPSESQNETFSHHHPPRFDNCTNHNASPSDHATLGDYQNPPPGYRITPINTYTYDTQVGLSEGSPHFFEFSQLTRYPVPSILPFPSSSAPCGWEQSVPSRATTFQSQRSCDGLYMHTELSDQESSPSDIHPRPASLFDDRVVDEILTAQQDSSICRQYAMASCTSYNGSVFLPTHTGVVGDFGACQPMYVCQYAFLHAAYYVCYRSGWESDWNLGNASAGPKF